MLCNKFIYDPLACIAVTCKCQQSLWFIRRIKRFIIMYNLSCKNSIKRFWHPITQQTLVNITIIWWKQLHVLEDTHFGCSECQGNLTRRHSSELCRSACWCMSSTPIHSRRIAAQSQDSTRSPSDYALLSANTNQSWNNQPQ